jgi:hypothetical protein
MPDQRAHEYYLEQAELTATHAAAASETLSKEHALELAKEVQYHGDGILSDPETNALARHLERLSRGVSYEDSHRLRNVIPLNTRHPQELPTRVSVQIETLEKMTTALQKANQLLERHIGAGQKTVPAAALHFILREAGFGSSQLPEQEVKQAPKQQQEVTNQLNHSHKVGR